MYGNKLLSKYDKKKLYLPCKLSFLHIVLHKVDWVKVIPLHYSNYFLFESYSSAHNENEYKKRLFHM